jgi:DNA polymerase I-like protein with 3'-5' exonuclease and polymerase domains
MFGVVMEDLPPEERDALRATAKIIMLGSQYGGSPKVLQREMRKHKRTISLEEAERFQTQLFDTFKGLARMRDRANAVAEEARRKRSPIALELASGMQRIYLPDEVSGPSLLATRISSLAAIGLKIGLGLVKDAGLLRYVVACVHDELLLLAPEPIITHVVDQVHAAMTEGMRRVCPEARIVVESKKQHTWDKLGDPAVDVVPDDHPDGADDGDGEVHGR